MPRQKIAIHGWVNLHKDAGMSSTQASSKVRHILQAKKAGHAGTLDPFASGVLPVALGEATKLIPYMMEDKKTYEYIMRFGASTDTQDITGTFTNTSDIIPDMATIQTMMPQFVGAITQIPSHYSAIKINGMRAYDKIRQGDTFDMPQRTVTIYSNICHKQLNKTDFLCEATCASGTYIRTLAHDIALKCGSFAHLIALKRTKVSIFDDKDAFSLEKIARLYDKEQHNFLLPMNLGLNGISVINIGAEQAKKLCHGHAISLLGVLPIEAIKQIPHGAYFMPCFNQRPLAITAYDKGYLVIKRGFSF